MSLWDLVLKSRTRRRFYEKERMKIGVLRDLVDLGRLSPSAGNNQPLKYMLSNEPKRNAAIFECLEWAGYLEDWDGPEEGERPAAYIVVLGDTGISKSFKYDAGLAVQSIMLGAAESDLGGCIFGAVDRKKLRESLTIPEQYEILLVLGLGKPRETVTTEAVSGDDIRYWRDRRGVHHVPKRRAKDIIIS